MDIIKKIGKGQEFIAATKEVTLDELFEEAGRLGKLETGSWGRPQADLRVNFSGSDYVSVKCDKYSTLKENLSDVISRAYQLKKFYENIN